MSGFVQLAADLLVAILLVATIAVAIKLSRNIAKMRADESAMRAMIAELVVATDTAERAISGLRSTLDECDRSLAERLRAAERCAADLSGGTAGAEAVLARIGAIVDKTRRAVQHRTGAGEPAGRPAGSALEMAMATAQAVADRASRRSGARAA